MSRNVAVSIGVKKAGELPELPGAIAGAKEFRDWAEKNHYECKLITDETGPVELATIMKTIKAILEDDVDRLLIFYAGHGQSTQMGDYWLLSRCDLDGNEAVNCSLSFIHAKRWPIGQVGIFADACRSADAQAIFVGGGTIFPTSKTLPRRVPEWDQFQATRLGQVAQEVVKDAYGIFSRCLLTALNGAAPDAIETRSDQPPGRFVSSEKLARYLEAAVRLESGRLPGGIVQLPETTPSWHRPNDYYLSLAADVGGPGLAPPSAEPADDDLSGSSPLESNFFAPTGTPPIRSLLQGLLRLGAQAPRTRDDEVEASAQAEAREAVRLAETGLAGRVRQYADLFAASRGRRGFETRTGLTIIGAEIEKAVVHGGRDVELFWEDDAQHVRGHGGEPQTVALHLASGAWIGTAMLPDFVGTIVVGEGVAQSLNYVPSHNNTRGFAMESGATSSLVYHWTASLQEARTLDKQDLVQVIENFRTAQYVNPTLGLLSSYAYERIGGLGEIDHIVEYFRRADQPVPFDVAYLSTLTQTQDDDRRLRLPDGSVIAGTFPLMTRGWAYLDPEDKSRHPELQRLRTGLRPSLWTTLAPPEGARLAALIHSGEL